MIRRPTPPEVFLAWHRAAIAGKAEANFIDHPECGWFKRKLVKGGPFVAARIWLRQDVDEAGELLDDEVMLCEVNGENADPHDQWNWLAGNPIPESEFQYLMGLRDWAAWHAPEDPAANPTKPLDHLSTPIRF